MVECGFKYKHQKNKKKKHVLKRDWSMCSKTINHSTCNKIDVPDSVIYLSETSIFEWYMVRCDSKNKYQKSVCLKEIGLHAQNMITFLNLTINLIGGTYVTI